MIDKLTPQTRLTTLAKPSRARRKKNTQPDLNLQQDRSLVDQIVSELRLDDKTDIRDIRRELIVKTLSKALGEKASGSPVFKKLIEQIEQALMDNELATEKLNELKNKHS